MIAIDGDEMLIAITRGDTASIVFSAVDEEGTTYTPQLGDVLKFAVANKVGETPLFTIENTMGSSAEDFWQIDIESQHTAELDFQDYAWDLQIESGSSVDTIIGKTDDVSPIFRVWGEIAQQEE